MEYKKVCPGCGKEIKVRATNKHGFQFNACESCRNNGNGIVYGGCNIKHDASDDNKGETK